MDIPCQKDKLGRFREVKHRQHLFVHVVMPDAFVILARCPFAQPTSNPSIACFSHLSIGDTSMPVRVFFFLAFICLKPSNVPCHGVRGFCCVVATKGKLSFNSFYSKFHTLAHTHTHTHTAICLSCPFCPFHWQPAEVSCWSAGR